MPIPQICCKDLTLGYDGRAVVTGLTFEVNAGDYLCVVGENGSGKSTLIKTLLRLMQPLAGQIEADGASQKDIGYIPQQTAAQRDFPASVREVVLSGCLSRVGFRPFYNKAEKLMANSNMERLGVLHLSKRCYRELSGGQQQRVLLARALSAAKKLLLMDEPAAGLDPRAAAEMYSVVEKLNAEGLTIIMISHDIAAAVKFASHILHIGGESAVFFGTKPDYLKSESGRAFAGVPDDGGDA